MWVLTVLVETDSSPAISGRRQVGGQVAQHPDLAAAERIKQRPRRGPRRERVAGLQVHDPGDQGGVCGALPGVALEQGRRWVQQEPQQRTLGFGLVERLL